MNYYKLKLEKVIRVARFFSLLLFYLKAIFVCTHRSKTKQNSHMAGRKTYTEDELQAALRDIQSGKLGTRRAAVIYGIPRSTLRNKVYKMALERDSGMRDPSAAEDPVAAVAVELANEDDDDDDRDTASAGEEDCAARPAAAVADAASSVHLATAEKNHNMHHQSQQQHLHHHSTARPPPYLSVQDLFRMPSAEHGGRGQGPAPLPVPTAEALRLFLQHYAASNNILPNGPLHQPEHHRGRDAELRSPSPPTPRLPDLWPAAAAAAAAAAAFDPQHMGTYLARLLQTSSSSHSALASSPRVGRDSPPSAAQPSPHDFFKGLSMNEMMRKMLHNDDDSYTKTSDARHDGHLQHRWSSNGCSAEPMDVVASRSNDDDSNPSNVILKIPSYKPVPGSKSDAYDSGAVGQASAGRVSPTRGPRSDTSSPPFTAGKPSPVNLREVIAQSITNKFQQPEAIPAAESFARAYHQYQQGMPMFSSGSPIVRNHNNNNLLEDRKRVPTPTHAKPSSSVSGSPSGGGSGFQPSGSSSNSSGGGGGGGGGAGGKGTRPKRGKYRNYDRDSLVEAVRAVQRGEMSVHRAGSYYGVPHSTLEYKVKERHLMRPRKREPKNPPPASSVSAAAIAEQDRKKDAAAVRPASSKTPPAVKLAAHVFPSSQPSLAAAAAAANGLKMFDAGAPVSPYGQPPFPFWSPNPFHVPMEFSRNSVAYTSMSMMQRIQAETRLHQQAAASIASLGKNAREVAENLYDGSDNGSFLDGIIRSSLETGLKSAAALAAAQAAKTSGGSSSSSELIDQLGLQDGPRPTEQDRTTPPSAAESASDSEDEPRPAAAAVSASSSPPLPHQPQLTSPPPPPSSEQPKSDSDRAAKESSPETGETEPRHDDDQ